MFELLYKGGPVMIFIGFFSVLALAMFFERLYILRRDRVLPQSLLGKLRELLKTGRKAEAVLLCEQDASPLSQVLEAGLKAKPEHRTEKMDEAGRRAVALLRKNLSVLGTTAAVSPLLGLLGTVTGMISVFQDVTQYGVGNPGDLAQGIWEALITTAAGLVVAIPAYLAYRYLVSRVETLTLLLEAECSDLISVADAFEDHD